MVIHSLILMVELISHLCNPLWLGLFASLELKLYLFSNIGIICLPLGLLNWLQWSSSCMICLYLASQWQSPPALSFVFILISMPLKSFHTKVMYTCIRGRCLFLCLVFLLINCRYMGLVGAFAFLVSHHNRGAFFVFNIFFLVPLMSGWERLGRLAL